MIAVHRRGDVFIGEGAMAPKGVTIESGSVIAAGPVVTCDMPAMFIAAGVLGRLIGSVTVRRASDARNGASGMKAGNTDESLFGGKAA
ncbi:hypothetical protein [Thauera sinica]|uniref:Uncharacterized protein n=1 Tax=Thauera sinica TaxID=2665146 RepID=A0ABW1AN33_9RHOO